MIWDDCRKQGYVIRVSSNAKSSFPYIIFIVCISDKNPTRNKRICCFQIRNTSFRPQSVYTPHWKQYRFTMNAFLLLTISQLLCFCLGRFNESEFGRHRIDTSDRRRNRLLVLDNTDRRLKQTKQVKQNRMADERYGNQSSFSCYRFSFSSHLFPFL